MPKFDLHEMVVHIPRPESEFTDEKSRFLLERHGEDVMIILLPNNNEEPGYYAIVFNDGVEAWAHESELRKKPSPGRELFDRIIEDMPKEVVAV